MPGISNKALQMPASPIRKLVPYAETAINQGKKVFFLNIGQPDIETPKNVRDKISNHNLKVIEYSHSAGFESYRKGLAKYYKGVGVDVNHEQIIVTTGGSEALLFGFMSCFDEGDEVIIPALTVIMDAYAVIHNGGTPVFADVDETTPDWTPWDTAPSSGKSKRRKICDALSPICLV